MSCEESKLIDEKTHVLVEEAKQGWGMNLVLGGKMAQK